MKRKIISILIISILLCAGFEILTHSKEVMNAVSFSIHIWITNLFPALFPFFILSELLIQYGFVEFLGELLKKIMNRWFHLKGECAFVLAMSMVSGFPSGAKYTKALLQEGIINELDATKLLTFTHFSNPLFIMGTIAITFFNDQRIGILILLCHFCVNFLIGFFFRNYTKSHFDKEKVSLSVAINKMHQKRIHNNLSFGQIVTNSILNTIKTLLLMLGVVTFFLIITTLIKQNLVLDPYHQSLLNGFFEMTQGCSTINQLNLPLVTRAIWTTFFISFGGLSVHMQVVSIICDTKIKYFPFFIARLLHAALASFAVFLLLRFFV